jgi:hypothetical protein
MLVRNHVTKDARVLKEANTLINSGHEVTVIGIQDAIVTQAFEVLPNGLKIYRTAWKTRRAFYMICAWIGALVLSILLVAYLESAYQVSSLFLNAVIWFSDKLIETFPVIGVLLIQFIVLIFFAKKIQKARRVFDYEVVRESLKEKSTKATSRDGWLGLFLVMLKYFGKIIRFLGSPIRTLREILIKYSFALKIIEIYRGIKRSLKYSTNHLVSLIAYRQAVFSIVDEIGADIIHAHDISTLPVGVGLKKRLNVPLVYDAHEIYEEAVGVPFLGCLLYKTINRYMLTSDNVDLFITINESFIDYYQKTYPSSPKGILVMNAAVKSDFVKYDGRLHDAAAIDHSKKIILFQGGFTKKRGVMNLLEAAPYLSPEWAMVFMGWGFYETEIAKHAEYEGSNISMIGPAAQSELALWTSGATVGVIPYEEHGLNHKFCTPNKLWEYPNALVPILATPRVELSRIISENGTGKIMSEPVDPRIFADEMMFSNEDVAEYKKHCRTFIESNSWAKYEDNLLQGYGALLSEKEVA